MKILHLLYESKGDYFMGSDFTYDDISDRTPDQDNHQLLRTEELNKEICYVVESIPKEQNSMYSKTISWVMKDKWLFLKREFYDKDKKLLKVEHAEQYMQIGGIWTTIHRVMENIQKKHVTDIVYSNYKYNIGIDDSKFTEHALKMGL
jgi:outer membrane lipoprotein-sorting protein